MIADWFVGTSKKSKQLIQKLLTSIPSLYKVGSSLGDIYKPLLWGLLDNHQKQMELKVQEGSKQEDEEDNNQQGCIEPNSG